MGADAENEDGGAESTRVFRLRMYEGDVDIPFRVCRSMRARSIRLSVDRHYRVTLTLPRRTPEHQGVEFLRSKAGWLRRHLSRKREPEDLFQFLVREASLSIDGERAPLELRRTGKAPAVRYSRGRAPVVVELGENGATEGDLAAVLHGLAARVLEGRTRHLAERHGFAVKRVTVRDQSTRWGSCSCSGTISLNWRLLLVPPEIQDYVILHELAHLRQMNHSAAYWRELTALDPRARERDRWLNDRGETVMALGRDR
jgi:predicted metal-dependent hydrolase